MTRRAVAPEKVHAALDSIPEAHARWALSQVVHQNQLNHFRAYAFGKDDSEASALPPVTQSDFAAGLQVTSSHVSKITASLLDGGFVTNTGTAPPTGAGRPRRPLKVNPNLAVLSVVIEDDAASMDESADGEPHGRVCKIVAAAIGLDGSLKHPITREAIDDETDDETLLERIIAVARGVVRKHAQIEWLGMSLVLGGQVKDGNVDFSVGMGDRRGRIPAPRSWADTISEKIGLPVTVENDANSLAQFDAWVGRRPEKTYLYVTIKRDGIGAGVVLDGVLMGGYSGELGHFPVDTRAMFDQAKEEEVPECRCGHHGCLEAIATPNSIANQLAGHEIYSFDPVLEDYLNGHPTPESAQAFRVFKLAGRALGVALAGTMNLVSADLVVLSGEPALVFEAKHASASIFLDGMRDALTRYSTLAIQPRIACMNSPTEETELAAAALCSYARHLDASRPLFEAKAAG